MVISADAKTWLTATAAVLQILRPVKIEAAATGVALVVGAESMGTCQGISVADEINRLPAQFVSLYGWRPVLVGLVAIPRICIVRILNLSIASHLIELVQSPADTA